MNITTLPRPLTTAKPAAKPADAPELRFHDSAQSFSRDAFLAVGNLGVYALPHAASRFAGPALGALQAMAGFGELKEGIRHSDSHQAIDGTLHMVAGGLTAALGVTTSNGLAPWLLIGSLGLLGAKAVFDHPGDLAKFTVHEGVNFVKDSVSGVGVEIREAFTHPKKTEEPPKE